MDVGHGFYFAVLDDEVDTAPPRPSTPTGLGLDPRTALASDFLNQFSEAIALLELLAQGECFALDDLGEWRPRGYAEHFETSRLPDAPRVLAAWRDAPPLTQRRLDAVAHEFGAVLTSAAAFLGACHRYGAHASIPTMAAIFARDARTRLATLDSLIHAGRRPMTQSAVTALFTRRAA